MLRFFGLYVGVAIVMCAKNALVLAASDGPLVWPAVVVEVVLAVGSAPKTGGAAMKSGWMGSRSASWLVRL